MGQKTDKLNIRLTPELKEILRKIARKENRSISNMVETLVLDRGKEHGVVKPDTNDQDERTGRRQEPGNHKR